MPLVEELPVHRCGDCPWYQYEEGLCGCTHPHVDSVAAEAGKEPPLACPLRSRSYLVRVREPVRDTVDLGGDPVQTVCPHRMSNWSTDRRRWEVTVSKPGPGWTWDSTMGVYHHPGHPK